MTSLDDWIEGEARFSAREMLSAISATGIVKERPGFGQRVAPARGSVLASPVPAAYDPDPDYFFHWFRDAAIVIDALRVAHAGGWLGAEAVAALRDFVRFNQFLGRSDGKLFLDRSDFRAKVQPSFRQYLRAEAEIAAINAGNVFADVRVNPDGEIDFTTWARPQHDGPALRALALLEWQTGPATPDDLRQDLWSLVDADLAFTLARAETKAFDIWEEELGFHYFTQLVQAEALVRGAAVLTTRGETVRAERCAAAARIIAVHLDALWDEHGGFYRSRDQVQDGDPQKLRDVAVVLAVLHAGRKDGPHSPLDPKAQATLAALAAYFARAYGINRGRAAPAMGRYPGDLYYGGGAWYVSTLAAAEFHYRLAVSIASSAMSSESRTNTAFRLSLLSGTPTGAIARGDAFMMTVRTFTPERGQLSEQFDRNNGAQTSAKRLTWSYAAFVTAAASRKMACASIRA